MKKIITLLIGALTSFASLHPLYAGEWKTLDELKSIAGFTESNNPEGFSLNNYQNYRFKKIRLTCDNLNGNINYCNCYIRSDNNHEFKFSFVLGSGRYAINGGDWNNSGLTALGTKVANNVYEYDLNNLTGGQDETFWFRYWQTNFFTSKVNVYLLTTYTLTVEPNNTEYGTVTGGGVYEDGASVTIEATPNTNYRFVRWSDGNTSNPRTLTITQDSTLTAQFEPTCQHSGTCGAEGDNLTWELSCDGVLTISGTGAMQDLSSSTAAWKASKSSILSVVIEEGVTSIGSNAFSECSNIESISIPNSVTSIGSFAFYSCSNLLAVTIPEGVTTINMGLFAFCSNLETVTIPSSVTNIVNSNAYGQGIFEQSWKIKDIYVSWTTTPPTLGYAWGTQVHAWSSHTLHVPYGTLSIYQAANNWKAFTIVEDPCLLASGTCGAQGDNLTWELSCDGVLTISGTGEMADREYNSGLWYDYREDIKSIIINDGVTSIGENAFRECVNVTSIIIPNSVTNIGNCAFFNCSSLTEIILPNGITAISWYGFYGCSSLTSVNIPNGVTIIHDSAFRGCTSLVSVIIPNSVTELQQLAFYLCSGLKSVTIGNQVPKIPTTVFYGCSSLESITIPSSVTGIGQEAFGGCSSLISISVEAGNTVYDSRNDCNAIIETASNKLVVGCQNTIIPSSVTSIEEYAFSHRIGLTSITIPSKVTSIGRGAFHSCNGLTSVTCEAATSPTMGTNSNVFQNVDCSQIPLYVPAESIDAYKAADQWKEFDIQPIPGTGPCITASGTCGAQGDNLTWELSCEGVLTISGTGAMADWNGIATPWEDYKQQITTVILPDGITKIGLAAFKNCTNLTAINIPEGVAGIESNTFSGCTSLNNIVLPQSVSFIRSYAFYNCTGLTAINIPDNVTTIGNHAFRNCTALTDIAIPDKVTSIGIWAFHSCSALTNLTLGSGLTDIQEKAFYNCTNLTAVTIPSSVTTIGDYAFYGCSSLASLTIDNSAAEIGKGAFYECAAMTTAVLGNRLTGIGVEAFYGCATLLAVDIPATVTALGDYAFRNCPAMTSATFRAVTPPAIGNAAFFETPCTFYVPCGSKDAYKEALSVSADRVEETIIPFVYSVTSSDETQGTVTLTQEPVSCDNLTLAFRADANNGYQFVQWSDGNTDNPRTVVLTQDITLTAVFELDQCILGSGTCGDNLTWELSCDGVLSISGTGGMADFAKETAPWNAQRNAISSVSVGDGVTSIGRFAFYECANMASVAIPEGVTSIGDSAFYHCAALSELVLPNTLTTIGYRAFRDCFSLTSVTIPESVTSLGCGGTFQRCNALTTVNWNARNSEILPNADESYSPPFYSSEGGLPGITTFNFGENVERIPATLCYGMSGLTSITFPDGLKRIDNSAFSECAGLTSITIPANVEKTGNSVFNACTSLKEVTMLPETAPAFGSYIFSNISSNFSVIVPCGTMDAYKSALSFYASKIKYLPLEFSVSALVNEAVAGSVTVPANRCENMFTAVANEGYEFVRWADGETTNPRMVVLTQDTVLTAVFESTAIPQNDTTFIHDGENPDIEDIPGNDPNIVVEPGGELNVNWLDIRLGVITIITAGGQSGQIHNAENLANWRFFMEYKLNPFGQTASPNLWYAFAVPFEVDIENGITRAYGKKSHVPGVDFQILEYDGMLRAQTGKGWVKKNAGSLEPGTFYMIGIEGNCNRWLFEKKSDAAIQGDSHVNLNQYFAGNSDNGKHNGWNGKGNSRLEYSEMDLSGIAEFIYLYNNEFGKFEVTAAAGIELCVGQPFFIQASADAEFDFVHNGGTHPMPALRAPQTAKPQMHFTLTSGQMHVGTDHMYVTMHEDAATTYTIGRDVARMSMNCKTAAQLWCLSADGTELAAHDIALPETETVIPLGLFAPKNGEYLLNMSERATDDFEVELLYNGTYAATLFADQPLALTLNAGTTTDYSIRVRRRMPTGLNDQLQMTNDQCTKVLIDNHLYILKGAQIFDAQGKLVK